MLYLRNILPLFALLLCTLPATARADLDSEVADVFMNGFVNPGQVKNSSRAASRSLNDTIPYYDPTLALLHTVRNWDNLREETREELSRYIEITPGKNGSRSVRSIASNGCPEVISETSDLTVDSAHFRIIYTDTGQHAATSDYANSMLSAAEYVWTAEINSLGMPPPVLPEDQKLRIYICDLFGATSILGRTFTTTTYSDYTAGTFIEMDNDYDGAPIPDDSNADEYAAMVFAHEFFHAIQFGINYSAPSYWLMESNAVWAEDEVYPDNNDYLTSYVRGRFASIGTSIDHFEFTDVLGYGAAIFFRFITERVVESNPPQQFIVDMWSNIKSECADLSQTWCDEDITETPLIDSMLADENTDIQTVYRNFNVANYIKDYNDGALSIFPPMPTTAVDISSGGATKSGTLSHLAAKFFKVSCSSCSTLNKLNIAFDADATTTWAISVIEERESGATVKHLPVSGGNATFDVNGFGPLVTSIIIIVNNVSLANDSKDYSISILQSADNTQMMTTTLSPGWQIIGLPLDPVDSAPSIAYNNLDLIFYQLKNNKYLVGDTLEKPAAGMAYWIFLDSQTSITLAGLPHGDPRIILSEGWNIVSVPSDTAVTWNSSVQVYDGTSYYNLGTPEADALLESTIYTYDESEDDLLIVHELADNSSIDPWSGFMIRAISDCTIVFPSPE